MAKHWISKKHIADFSLPTTMWIEDYETYLTGTGIDGWMLENLRADYVLVNFEVGELRGQYNDGLITFSEYASRLNAMYYDKLDEVRSVS